MTASLEVRTDRRVRQLSKKSGQQVDYDKVMEDIKTRDENDTNRKVAPLKQAEDAIFYDTSDDNIEQVVEKICGHAREKASEVGLNL